MLANHQSRHKAASKMGCQPGDSSWIGLLWYTSGVCVVIYRLSYSLYHPWGCSVNYGAKVQSIRTNSGSLRFKARISKQCYPYNFMALTIDKSRNKTRQNNRIDIAILLGGGAIAEIFKTMCVHNSRTIKCPEKSNLFVLGVLWWRTNVNWMVWLVPSRWCTNFTPLPSAEWLFNYSPLFLLH